MSAKMIFKCDLCGKEKNTNFFLEMETGFPTARNWIDREFHTRTGLKIIRHRILTCSEECDAEILQRLQVSTTRFVPRVFFDEINNAPHLDS